MFFYIEECYHYVPFTDTKTIRCRELCQNIINDLFINETVIPTPTTMTNSSSSVFTTKNTLQNNANTGNYTLMADNTTSVQRLITICIEKQCLQEDVSTGPTCSLSTDPNLLMKWMSFSFIVIFTIGKALCNFSPYSPQISINQLSLNIKQ